MWPSREGGGVSDVASPSIRTYVDSALVDESVRDCSSERELVFSRDTINARVESELLRFIHV